MKKKESLFQRALKHKRELIPVRLRCKSSKHANFEAEQIYIGYVSLLGKYTLKIAVGHQIIEMHKKKKNAYGEFTIILD